MLKTVFHFFCVLTLPHTHTLLWLNFALLSFSRRACTLILSSLVTPHCSAVSPLQPPLTHSFLTAFSD